MGRRRRFARLPRALSFLAATLAASMTAQLPALADDIDVGGTGAGLGVMRLLANAFAESGSPHHVTVLPSLGSSGGIRAVGDAALNLAISSRPLKEKERNKGLAARVLARTPFVFVVTPFVGADGLTLDQVADIYALKTTRWTDGTPIRLVLRPANDSDNKLLKSLSPAVKQAVETAEKAKGMVIATTDQDNLNAVEEIPGALGGTSLGQVRSEGRKLKVLALDGVTPAPETLADGRYPFGKTLYLVTGPRMPPPVRAFVDFCFSPAGRRILARSGYLAR